MILILGVTASGKAALGFELAKKLGGQIISVDSMKVYRRMDIGTAKASPERQKEVKYHIIDVVEPSESFSVDQFLNLKDKAVEEITADSHPVIAVGGTAMYIKAMLFGLFDGPGSDEEIRSNYKKMHEEIGGIEMHRQLAEIDPQAAERIHPNDARRLVRAMEVYELTGKPISSFQQQWSGELEDKWTVIGLRRDKDLESRRINQRVKKMIDAGLVGEARSLLNEPKPISRQARAAIGYAEMFDHLEGKMSLDEAIEKIKINTRKLAKAQRTWFKTFRFANWIDIEEDQTIEIITEKAMEIIDGR